MGQGEELEKVQGEGRINSRRSGTKHLHCRYEEYVLVSHLDELCQGADGTAKGKARKALPLIVVP